MNKISKFNLFLSICFTIISIITSIILKDFIPLLFILIVLVPYILKLNNIITTIYLIFLFFASFIGGILNVYKLTNWYDSFVHSLWGFLSSYLAIYILTKLKILNKKNTLFNILFIFIVCLASAAIWEVIEFSVDSLFNMDMQRRLTGVFDTMKDIIVALIGNLVFIMFYKPLTKKFIRLLGRWSYVRRKNNWFIKKYW